MKVHIISELQSLKAAQSAWERLSQLQYQPLNIVGQWQLLLAYLQTHQPSNWKILLAYQHPNNLDHPFSAQTQWLGILPLALTTISLPESPKPLNIAVPLASQYQPYQDILLDPNHCAEVWQAFFQVCREYFTLDGLLLGRFHQTSTTLAYLVTRVPQSEWAATTVNVNYWVNPSYINYEAYAAKRSSKTIQGALTDQKRLLKKHHLAIRTSANTEIFSEGIDFIVHQMQAKLGERLYFNDLHAMGEMYKQLNRLEQSQGCTGQSFIIDLLIDDQRHACYLIQNYRDINAYIIGAYHPQYGNFSPSKILLNHLVKQSFETKRKLCFGQGNYAYKADWSNEKYDLNAIALFFTDQAKAFWKPYIKGNSLNALFKIS